MYYIEAKLTQKETNKVHLSEIKDLLAYFVLFYFKNLVTFILYMIDLNSHRV